MEGVLKIDELSGKNWAFFWRPYWKGIAWLICFLVASICFTWLKSFYVGFIFHGNPLTRLCRLPVLLLDPFIWLGALLSWKALQKDGWAIGIVSKAGRRVFIMGYLSNAMSLFVLISIARVMLEVNSFVTYPMFRELISGVGWWSISTSILIHSVSFASVVSLGVPMFLLMTFTFIPQERGKLTAIILPAMLTILLSEATFFLAMHGMILLSTRLNFHVLGMYDMCLYQQFIVLLVILGLGYLVMNRLNVRQTGNGQPVAAGGEE